MAKANQGDQSIIHALRDALLQFAVKSKKLALPILEPFGRRTPEPATVDADELRALKSKLQRIRAALRDAERLSVSDHSVRLWLSELGDLEQRAEDVVEELEYESRRAAQLEELKADLLCAAATGKRRREVALLFTAAPARRLRRKVDDIWARYEEISSDRRKLRLRPGDGAHSPAAAALQPSSALLRCQLHGRDRDVEKVAALVVSGQQHDGGKSYAVVPVVGMAGVGKTALVQHVFHTGAVKSRFEMMLWIWVSQEVDVIGATRKIVEAITRSRPECGELSTLHELIVENRAGKRCLIVLDDVWDDNPSHWDCLMAPLSRCTLGSTVVVTTRSWKVARMVSPKVYHLKCLSDDSCWLMCRQRALPNSNVDIDPELVSIGEKVARKCGGLPLAAEAVGSALSTSISRKHWDQVLESDLWADNEVKNLVLPALKVSYDHLSMPLKRCFAICSLFPKGFIFDKDALVQLWMALGFVDAVGGTPELIGSWYFNDLVSRCFFQPSRSHHDGEGKFIMHDLYQELAQFVSGSECRMVQNNNSMKTDESPRHLSFVSEAFHSGKELHFNCSHDYRELRTFLFLARTEQNHDEIPCKAMIPSGLVTDFEYIRALDLSNTNIMELPKSIGNLIHLRYLGLENTSIQMLPESICALFHLQTIKLNNCSSLTQLPQGIKLLRNLRCLEIPHSNIQIPSEIGELTRLQRLPVFRVGNESSGCGIEKLNELVNLRGHLHILGLNNNLDIAEAAITIISNKLGIKKLTLEWFVGPEFFGDISNMASSSSSKVCNTFPALESLTFRNMEAWDEWFGVRSEHFPNLKYLGIAKCRKLKLLPKFTSEPELRIRHCDLLQMHLCQISLFFPVFSK
ncbi:hypothetical protein PR202_ga30521 [Eleusine coracana subsp. coracana]|uniref:Uncharacterized protein n=1 Tax=Eleusine coracana subsp. coracana TaxID=191504 RepID=A0AAV5DPE3_ELECO|nr:hypothetical protein PR202_ga30487 [Eleusine coracana subsp. coracana]GJN12259.1 hypothetical protein PR202_ga30521 [Eleusine coracana subsp. coracana]